MKCRFKSSLGYWLIFIYVFLLLPAVTACRSSKHITTEATTETQIITDAWLEIISPAKISAPSFTIESKGTPTSFDPRAGARRSTTDPRAGAPRSVADQLADTTLIHISAVQHRKAVTASKQETYPKSGASMTSYNSYLTKNLGWLLSVAVCAAALVFCVRYLKI